MRCGRSSKVNTVPSELEETVLAKLRGILNKAEGEVDNFMYGVRVIFSRPTSGIESDHSLGSLVAHHAEQILEAK